MIMRRTIKFLLNDRMQTLEGFDPTLTLLDWLRNECRLTGTKEGCAEGDCGACSVLVGRLRNGELRYEAINACIRFVAMLDGCHVVTVEHLKKRSGGLHPVQQAMVELHGSQCGFCTPGIVMSLTALWLGHDTAPSRERIEEALAGNLCRCTGYGPIVAALGRAYEIEAPSADRLAVERADVARKLGLIADRQVVEISDGERTLFAPATSDQLADLVASHPDATIVAGATDVGLWITKMLMRPAKVIALGRVSELDRIEDKGDRLVIGALASLRDAREALGALDPQIDEMLRRFGSEQVRNAGTVGGNVANGSPIGDTPPLLIALDASVTLRRGTERRTVPLEKFFIAYKKQDRQPGDFVEEISVPKPKPGALLHVSKISKRFDEDISSVCGVFRLERDAGGKVTEAVLAFGGMAATPKRAAAAEAALLGKVFDRASAEAAAEALATDFTPLDDWRASARYRATVAANLIRRFQAETAAGAVHRVAGILQSDAHA
ncbi:xanthine dehydrogenase small subunit [Labrys miyagiensis]|uniref:Xanthine dehydrogenase small subunit n=1 Tax=Labrys miyagiensis TaxID=346912 RepID=A0ABQ6CHW6_9HYPH|nr:xanthine dehydrogenase small subunit [Labrys miyagiensis]